MANFNTALEALVKGDLHIDDLTSQIAEILQQTPDHANAILAELESFQATTPLSNSHYVSLKRQINQFRRVNASETETGDADDEATVFDLQQAAEEFNQSDATEIDSVDDAEDVTAINENAADDDATEINEKTQIVIPDDNDSTEINEKTQIASASADDVFDLTSDISQEEIDSFTEDDGDNTVPQNTAPPDTSPSLATSTGWADPIQQPQQDFSKIGVGSVIKDRFRLLDVLGEGGMGKVYKGIDLLKEEAKDRNPYCAIKLLNDDFKDHPEAFISLQRESSRQQRLAHPNIATVYDFDRLAGKGTPVFLTMEFMEGLPLDAFIKKEVRKKGGIPFEEAYPMIYDMGQALVYAHERMIVHSDFKPGNCFLLKTGEVKVLDFGIARAVKNPITGEGEKTLFDAGELGALTPAYASLEMLEGEEPDTRDDTYALGCTAYQLLIGKHPFNRLAANKAMENNLEPPYVKSLNKKQNRALRRSVAFKREDRSPNVAHFLEELKGEATWHKSPWFIAAMALLIIGIAMINPALSYLQDQKIKAMVVDVNKSSPSEMVQQITEIKALDEKDQATVLTDSREAIQNYYGDKIAALTNTAKKGFSFDRAFEVLKEAEDFYPASIFIEQQTEIISDSKTTYIEGINAEYLNARARADLIPGIAQVISKIKQVDPQSIYLNDPQLNTQFRNLARNKIAERDIYSAKTIVDAGIQLLPDDLRLTDVQNDITLEEQIIELESQLSVNNEVSLDNYLANSSTIKQLNLIAPDNDVLKDIKTSTLTLINDQVKTNPKDNSLKQSLANQYSELMSALSLYETLVTYKLAGDSGDVLKNNINDWSSENINTIQNDLNNVALESIDWEGSLLNSIGELSGLAKKDTSLQSTLSELQTQIGSYYIDASKTLMEEQRYNAAAAMISKGQRLAPTDTQLLATRTSIFDIKERQEREERIESNKEALVTLTSSNEIINAQNIWAQLKIDLGEDDIDYIGGEGADLMAAMYASVAEERAKAEDYNAALSFVNAGLEIKEFDDTLDALQPLYQTEVYIYDLLNSFATANTLDADVRNKVREIEDYSETRFSSFSREAEKLLLDRINELSNTEKPLAAGLAQSASSIFRDSNALAKANRELELQPWEDYRSAITLIRAGKLTEATELKDTAAGEFANHPNYLKFVSTLEKNVSKAELTFNDYQTQKSAAEQLETAQERFDELRLVKRELSRALDQWSDNPAFIAEDESLDALIAQNKPQEKPKTRRREVQLDESSVAGAEWSPVDSDQDCTTRLAGYGRRAKAICYDYIFSSARGPLMVVIPGVESDYAISKYEISISDWSKYCLLSGTCTPIKDKAKLKEPVTGITLQQAQSYATWLSERTGKTYRLPTNEEWEYAANAEGKQPKKDYNCQVTVQDKLIKGTGVVPVNSGGSNGWGLRNYVGNAQEWVLAGNEALVRGGAFTDPHAKCDISLQRAHNGNADEQTGFRLIREEVSDRG